MSAANPETAAPKQPGRRKLLMAVPILALLAGGGAWASGAVPKLLGKAEVPNPEQPVQRAPVFMELPEIVANLNAGARRTSFIKLKARLELSRPEDQAALQAAMPRILDLFQTFLREMRPEELRGTASTHRLREELIARTNLAAHPARVVGVLFTELLVQ